MPNENAGTASSDTPAGQIPVSPDNPCPFLRALVAGGFVGGHVVPLATLGQAVEAASGEQGLNKKLVGMKTFPIALIATASIRCACCAVGGPARCSTICAMVRSTSMASARASSTRPPT